jgi:hypothetical protein
VTRTDWAFGILGRWIPAALDHRRQASVLRLVRMPAHAAQPVQLAIEAGTAAADLHHPVDEVERVRHVLDHVAADHEVHRQKNREAARMHVHGSIAVN